MQNVRREGEDPAESVKMLQDFSDGKQIHSIMGIPADQPLRTVQQNLGRMKGLLSQNRTNQEIFIRSYNNDHGRHTIDDTTYSVPRMNQALRNLINENFALFRGFTFDTSIGLEPDLAKTISEPIERTE